MVDHCGRIGSFLGGGETDKYRVQVEEGNGWVLFLSEVEGSYSGSPLYQNEYK